MFSPLSGYGFETYSDKRKLSQKYFLVEEEAETQILSDKDERRKKNKEYLCALGEK